MLRFTTGSMLGYESSLDEVPPPFITSGQGDQMSLRKDRPKRSPRHFLSKLVNNFLKK
jgi:hypothetical protein